MDLASIFTGNDGGGVVAWEEAQVRGLRHAAAVGRARVGVRLLLPAAIASTTTRGAVVEEHARRDERQAPAEVVAGDDAVPGRGHAPEPRQGLARQPREDLGDHVLAHLATHLRPGLPEIDTTERALILHTAHTLPQILHNTRCCDYL
jgi:hypothetical protein